MGRKDFLNGVGGIQPLEKEGFEVKIQDDFVIETKNGESYVSGFVVNATYASTNQILEMAGFEKFKIAIAF